VRSFLFGLVLAVGCGVAESEPVTPPAHTSDGGAGGEPAGGGAPVDLPKPFEARVLYLTITDRFTNGDPANDFVGDAACTDPDDPIKFHGGDFAGLRSRLDYLQELGVGAVWMTPVYEQTGPHNAQCGYHGYWARYQESGVIGLEPKLGTDADLEAWITEAHRRDVVVIADMIVNHAGRGAPIVSERPDWLHDLATCAALGDPVVYCPLNGLPDFAQENPEVAAYLTSISTAMLSRFAFDGVRMDTAKHVLRAYFEDDWIPAVRGVRNDLFLLAEVFDESGPGALEPLLEAGFDSATGFPLRRGLIQAFAQGGSLDQVASRAQQSVDQLGLERANRLVNFLDNHDVPRFASEMPGTLSDAERTQRYRMALVALFTLPGIPQLYYGDELGMVGVWPENRRDMPPWAWTAETRDGSFDGYLGNPQETFALVAALASLRNAEPALYAGSYAELWRPNGSARNVFGFFRSHGDGRVIVLFNNGATAAADLSMKIQDNPGIEPADKAALSAATLDIVVQVGDGQLAIADGMLTVSLGPKSALVSVVR